ncbi:MAG TPA: TrbC/VirB2 family protein [Longimicrobium sp.]|nr:TrbC/VirB2 family protein [Longimicrobium sp.]
MSIACRFSETSTGARVWWSTLKPARMVTRTAWRNTWAKAGAFALGALLYSSVLMAGGTGTNMPWNAPLQNLLNNLTGPTARVVVGLGVALCGVIWMMKRHEEGAGRRSSGTVATKTPTAMRSAVSRLP